MIGFAAWNHQRPALEVIRFQSSDTSAGSRCYFDQSTHYKRRYVKIMLPFGWLESSPEMHPCD
jgi:hypothetical protein